LIGLPSFEKRHMREPKRYGGIRFNRAFNSAIHMPEEYARNIQEYFQ